MASPLFWSVYLNPLFQLLREAVVGCHVGGLFVGMVGYANDLLLLAPSRDAAQKMINTCEKFTRKNNIFFSTHGKPEKSKSKAIYVIGKQACQARPTPMVLCGKALPWVIRT